MNKKQLIRAVFKKPEIWDQRHTNHHNRYVLAKSWSQVAAQCNVSVPEAKRTWKVLRQTFKVHFDRLPPGSSGDPAPDISWHYFKSLLFLKDVFEQSNLTGNLKDECDAELKEETVIIMNEDYIQHIDNLSPSFTPYTDPYTDPSTPSSPFVEISTSPFEDSPRYPKGSATLDQIGQGLLEVEKEKLKLKKDKLSLNLNKDDEDVAFFTSLLPHVKKLPPVEKLNYRMKVQQILMEMAYGNQVHDPSPHQQLMKYDGDLT